MIDRFSPSAREAIRRASAEASISRAPSVEVEHLFLGLLHDSDTIASQALLSCGLSLETVRNQLESGDDESPGALTFGVTAKSALEDALRKASVHRSSDIGPEHLLLAALECHGSRIASILSLAGTTPGEVRRRVIGFIQVGQFKPTVVTGLVHEYQYESQLVEDAVARVVRVFGEGGPERSFLEKEDR